MSKLSINVLSTWMGKPRNLSCLSPKQGRVKTQCLFLAQSSGLSNGRERPRFLPPFCKTEFSTEGHYWLESSVSQFSGCGARGWEFHFPLRLLGEQPACVALGKLHKVSLEEANGKPSLSILFCTWEILKRVRINSRDYMEGRPRNPITINNNKVLGREKPKFLSQFFKNTQSWRETGNNNFGKPRWRICAYMGVDV